MRIALVIVLAALGVPLLRAQKPPAFVGAVQLPEDWEASRPSVHDVDGDGRLDLVIPSIERGEETHRRIAIHLRRDAGYSPNPDFQLDLQPDVTAYAVGDFCADAGLEVALISGSLVVIWRPKEQGAARFRDHFRASFIHQVPDNGQIVGLNKGVIDVDRDGLVDLVLLEPGGFRVALQRRDEKGTNWDADHVFRIPPRRIPQSEDESKELDRSRKSARFWEKIPEYEKARTGTVQKAPLVEIEDEAPLPTFGDFDGDGRLDCIARSAFEVYVWSDIAGTSEREPSLRFEAPVVSGRSRAADLAYASAFDDFNGDDLLDSVMFASDRRSDDPRTQVLIFLHSAKQNGAATPLFGEKGIPAQLLVLAGFTGGSHFVDVDGDGRKDLVIGALRPDIIDSLRGKAKDNTEVDCYVYLNRGSGFSKSPDLRQQLQLEIRGLGALTSGYLARFAGDYTKDGTAELVVRDRPERLRVFWTRKDKNGAISIYDKPLWEIPLDRDSAIVEVPATAKESAGFLVIQPSREGGERSAVALVRFGS